MVSNTTRIFFMGTQTRSAKKVAVFQNFGGVYRLDLKTLEVRIEDLERDSLDTSEEEKGLKELKWKTERR